MRTRIALVVFILTAASLFGQSVSDDFSSMRGWTPGPGDWSVRGGRMVQMSDTATLARADRMVTQSGVYEVEFAIRYMGGGYDTEADLAAGEYHGGFGIHVGVENPALGRTSWGSGNSYLIWLNLDTRSETRRRAPEHYGFRFQVYRSRSNSSMSLLRDRSLVRSAELGPYVENDLMSVDIIEFLQDYGVDLELSDLMAFLNQDVTINIRVNTRTGEIGVLDPTAPLRFYFTLDPAVLRGNYMSLRTNGLAAGFNYFRVD